MPSQIEQRYGTPLPIDVLWRELERRYGAAVVADLQATHRAAMKRYNRAAELNRRRRLVAHWEREGRQHSRLAEYRRALADPQAFIDRED